MLERRSNYQHEELSRRFTDQLKGRSSEVEVGFLLKTNREK